MNISRTTFIFFLVAIIMASGLALDLNSRSDLAATLTERAYLFLNAQRRVELGEGINPDAVPISRNSLLGSRLIKKAEASDVNKYHRITSFKIELKSLKVDAARNAAILRATENATFYFDKTISPGAPDFTSYGMDHIFTFIIEDGQWKLLTDQALDERYFSSGKHPEDRWVGDGLPPPTPEPIIIDDQPQAGISGSAEGTTKFIWVQSAQNSEITPTNYFLDSFP